MQQQFIDLVSKFNKVSVETTRDFFDINVRALEKCTQAQTKLATDYMESGLKQADAVREIKQPADFSSYVSGQTAEMQKCAEKFYTSAKDTVDLMVETADEINVWMKKRMDAASNLKPVSSKKAA